MSHPAARIASSCAQGTQAAMRYIGSHSIYHDSRGRTQMRLRIWLIGTGASLFTIVLLGQQPAHRRSPAARMSRAAARATVRRWAGPRRRRFSVTSGITRIQIPPRTFVDAQDAPDFGRRAATGLDRIRAFSRAPIPRWPRAASLAAKGPRRCASGAGCDSGQPRLARWGWWRRWRQGGSPGPASQHQREEADHHPHG